MKSIKEKSEEHLNSVYAGYDNVLKKLVKESYGSGANYVLEQVEMLLNSQRFVDNPSQELYKLIEQLKK